MFWRGNERQMPFGQNEEKRWRGLCFRYVSSACHCQMTTVARFSRPNGLDLLLFFAKIQNVLCVCVCVHVRHTAVHVFLCPISYASQPIRKRPSYFLCKRCASRLQISRGGKTAPKWTFSVIFDKLCLHCYFRNLIHPDNMLFKLLSHASQVRTRNTRLKLRATASSCYHTHKQRKLSGKTVDMGQEKEGDSSMDWWRYLQNLFCNRNCWSIRGNRFLSIHRIETEGHRSKTVKLICCDRYRMWVHKLCALCWKCLRMWCGKRKPIHDISSNTSIHIR